MAKQTVISLVPNEAGALITYMREIERFFLAFQPAGKKLRLQIGGASTDCKSVINLPSEVISGLRKDREEALALALHELGHVIYTGDVLPQKEEELTHEWVKKAAERWGIKVDPRKLRQKLHDLANAIEDGRIEFLMSSQDVTGGKALFNGLYRKYVSRNWETTIKSLNKRGTWDKVNYLVCLEGASLKSLLPALPGEAELLAEQSTQLAELRRLIHPQPRGGGLLCIPTFKKILGLNRKFKESPTEMFEKTVINLLLFSGLGQILSEEVAERAGKNTTDSSSACSSAEKNGEKDSERASEGDDSFSSNPVDKILRQMRKRDASASEEQKKEWETANKAATPKKISKAEQAALKGTGEEEKKEVIPQGLTAKGRAAFEQASHPWKGGKLLKNESNSLYSPAWWEEIKAGVQNEGARLGLKLRQELKAFDRRVATERSRHGAFLHRSAIAKVANGVFVKAPFAAKAEQQALSTEIVLLLDRSGSMSVADKEEGLCNASVILAEALMRFENAHLKLSVLEYANNVRVIKKSNDHFPFYKKISNFDRDLGGNTIGEAGVAVAAGILSQSKCDRRVLVVLTDGRWHIGVDYSFLDELGIESYGIMLGDSAFIGTPKFTAAVKVERPEELTEGLCKIFVECLRDSRKERNRRHR
ncbi:MAG: VWA domain-containing protein [Succinatimonas hippei]|nr:VWA domain-containing protein [Succinatimonas hippei]